MAKPNSLNIDASVRAGSELQSVLHKTDPKKQKRVGVEEALRQERIVKTDTYRSATRVLFISQDATLLNPDTQSLDGYLEVKDLFDEVHVLILRTGIPAKNPSLRVAENVWLYTASARSWWQLGKKGITLAEEQMVFGNGFRADLIVARDPFESAWVGMKLAEQYQRPLQIHVLKDYTSNAFKDKMHKRFLRQFMPRVTIPAAVSVRAETAVIMEMLQKRFSIPDLSLLPRLSLHQSELEHAPVINLADKYRQFSFFMLYVGKLGHDSTFFRALDAARFALANQRVGMIVIGDGPAKAEFQKRAKVLGIEKQLVFERAIDNEYSYLKSANVLLVTDTDEASNEIVLKGAAAGIPLILAENEYRNDLFESGVTALLCPADSTQAFSDAINEALNNINPRKTMAAQAKELIKNKFHQDVKEYRKAFQTSLEEAIFVDVEQPEVE